MKAFAPHYLNKYPGGSVDYTEDRLEVKDSAGQRRVSLRLNGNGQTVDVGTETGATDKHDLSPIPKNTRVHKLFTDGKIGLDDKAAERKLAAAALAQDGKVLSIVEYKAAGHSVDQDGNVTPKAPEAPQE